MTVWKPGMHCECIVAFAWLDGDSGALHSGPDLGDVLIVAGTCMGRQDRRTFWRRLLSRKVAYLSFKQWSHRGFQAANFRPLVEAANDAELIARIKNCKPAPAQPHEAGAQVGPCVQNLSSHTGSVAAGHTHVADSGAHALDNASSQFTDTQSFIPRHAERNS